MKIKSLSAKTARYVLISAILFVAVATIVGAWLLHSHLSTTIASANEITQKAADRDTTISNAQALKIYLEKNKAEIDKTAKIVADAKSYQYQNQIVTDITNYANASNVRILGFDFPVASSTKTKQASGALKSVSVTISLQDPIAYADYLRFLKHIEQNITKMQITEINISPDNQNPQLITNPTISLEVYIR